VTIGDRAFIPPTVEIAAGGTVEWTNNDSESHTATASDGTFDSGILAPGATFTQSFDTAGTFPFFCQIHPEMQGTITVSDPIEAVSSPTASLGATSPAPSPDASLPLPSAATRATVTLADRAFDPTSVEVPVGGGVDWSNEDQEGHTITASDGSFDSGVVGPGEAFSTTFEIAGTYDYFCAIHPEMQARVVVVDSVSSPVPESPGVSTTPGPGG
jgi:plastocyanin